VLRRVVRKKLDQRWSPSQISRFLTRSYTEPGRRLCAETIYHALFDGLLGARSGKLRTCGVPEVGPGSLTSGGRWSDMIPACRCGCCT
jgi:IS30 family transposase